MLDASVSKSIGDVFRDAHWTVIPYHEALSDGAPDDVVCATAIENNAVLLAIDKDMRKIVRNYKSKTNNARFRKLNLIIFTCDNVKAIARSKSALSFIENEWEFAQAKEPRRMFVEISNDYLRTHR